MPENSSTGPEHHQNGHAPPPPSHPYTQNPALEPAHVGSPAETATAPIGCAEIHYLVRRCRRCAPPGNGREITARGACAGFPGPVDRSTALITASGARARAVAAPFVHVAGSISI